MAPPLQQPAEAADNDRGRERQKRDQDDKTLHHLEIAMQNEERTTNNEETLALLCFRSSFFILRSPHTCSRCNSSSGAFGVSPPAGGSCGQTSGVSRISGSATSVYGGRLLSRSSCQASISSFPLP